MQDLVRGEDVPEHRDHGRRRRWIVGALVAVTLLSGLVATGARVDRVATPSHELIVGSDTFRMARHEVPPKPQAKTAPTPDPDGDLDAIGALALSLSLAVIVRMADRLPQGHRDRQALAEATGPLRAALYGRDALAA